MLTPFLVKDVCAPQSCYLLPVPQDAPQQLMQWLQWQQRLAVVIVVARNEVQKIQILKESIPANFLASFSLVRQYEHDGPTCCSNMLPQVRPDQLLDHLSF